MDPSKYCVACDEPDLEKIPGCPLQCRTPQCKAYQRRPPFDTDVTPIVWVMGGPGSGKYKLCKKIFEKYGFTHLSTGDMLRNEVAKRTDKAKCINSCMERGALVPNDFVLALIKAAMIVAADAGSPGYVVEGYPREKSQGIQFEQAIGHVSLLLFMDATMETLKTRLLSRAATSSRKDDNTDAIKLRLQTFTKYHHDVLSFYRDRVVKIDANQPLGAIYAQVQQAVDPIVARAQAIKAGEIERAANAQGLPTVTIARTSASNNQGNLVSSGKAAAPTAPTEARDAPEVADTAKDAAADSQKPEP